MSKLKDALSLFCKRSIVNDANDKNDIHEISRKNIAMIHSTHRILSPYHSYIAGCFIVFFFLRFAFCFFLPLVISENRPQKASEWGNDIRFF